MVQALFETDKAILLFVQEHLRAPVLDTVVTSISRTGDSGRFWLVLIVLLLIFARTRKGGLLTLCALAIEFLLCDMVVKGLFARIRPYELIEGLVCLVPPESSYSFPSGHSASSFVCAYVLTRCFGRRGALAYIPASLISLSRIYVCVHYPSDVLGGMVFGTLVGVAFWAVYRAVSERVARRREREKEGG